MIVHSVIAIQIQQDLKRKGQWHETLDGQGNSDTGSVALLTIVYDIVHPTIVIPRL